MGTITLDDIVFMNIHSNGVSPNMRLRSGGTLWPVCTLGHYPIVKYLCVRQKKNVPPQKNVRIMSEDDLETEISRIANLSIHLANKCYTEKNRNMKDEEVTEQVDNSIALLKAVIKDTKREFTDRVESSREGDIARAEER